MSAGFGQLRESTISRQRAEAHYEDQQNAEQARQAGIDSNISKVRDEFGVGDTGAAHANKAKIDNWLNDYEGANLDQNNLALQDDWGVAKLASRRQLASQGLLGGSVDAQNQRTQLSQYVAGRQKAVASARAARATQAQGLVTQRQNLEGQIASGTTVNPDFREIQGSLESGLDAAGRSIGANVASNAFTTAGNVIAQDQLARGRGNRGLDFSGSSTGSAAGTITGG